MTRREERQKRLIAALTTTGVNILILLIMIFAASWKSPGSGEGNYPGIEVNLGYDEQGSGDIQPDKPLGNEEATDDENPPVEPEAAPAEKTNPTPVEDNTDPKPVEPETMTDPNSDVEIKEVKKEVKPVEKAVEKKETEKPVEKKVEEKPKEVDTKAVYKGKTATTSTTTPGTGEGKQGTTGNQGDDEGKVGDKGVPNGTEGAAVYKGTPGGGAGGPSLDLYGWDWDNLPKPKTPENETSGRIVFTIEVDDNGELISYRKESGSVSPAAERACVDALQKLTFTKKSGAKVPAISKGKITFVIRAQ
jgi:protein TonB